MARPESVAVGGYFPTPKNLIPLIVGHLSVRDGSRANYADPCAGDGAALGLVSESLGGSAHLYTCEMEATRHAQLVERFSKDWKTRQHAMFGDAFLLEFSRAMSLLLLNPPYDIDRVHGRLEQRFLDRFTGSLVDGGLLIFIVPFYALEASAQTLALEYDNVQCFRFPKDEFAAFKQVVLFANKTDRRLAPDLEILDNVKAWSQSTKGLPLLGSKEATHEVPSQSYSDPTWRLQEMDLRGLLSKHRPWRETPRTKTAGALGHVPHVLPETPVQDLLFRVYPVATNPRPAHIAAGIASGLFNGRQVESDTPGMPKLLVKGVFTRDYASISASTNADGDVMLTQVQRPKLETTVLNLDTKCYSTLLSGGAGNQDQIEGLNIEGLLKHYGESLMDVMLQQCPVIYDAKRDGARLLLGHIARPLYKAQTDSAKALYQLMGGPGVSKAARRFKAAFLLGEVGTGKTATVLTVAQTMAKRTLAFCPPHLLADWMQETSKVLPDAVFRVLEDVSDVDALADVPKDRTLIAVVSRERAKLGHGWESVKSLGCPKCGAPLPTGDLAKKRVRCEAAELSPSDDLGKAACELALKVAPHAPKNGNVVALLSGRHMQRYLESASKRKGKLRWAGFDAAWVESVTEMAAKRLRAAYDQSIADLLLLLLLADYQPERIAKYAVELHGLRPDYYGHDFSRTLTCLLPVGSKLQACTAETTYKGHGWSNPSLQSDLTILKANGLHQHNSSSRVRLVDGELQINEVAIGSVGLARHLLSALATTGRFQRASECGEALFQAVPEPRRYPLSDYIAKYYPAFFDLLVLDEGQDYQNGDSAQGIAAHRLTSLGIPTILMTGSLMNGYAASLFTNMWYLSPEFRAEFGRDDLQKYLSRYGYLKRVISAEDAAKESIVAFGAHSDRVERAGRLTGYAPGILPLFLFRHLLAISVTLHKADLDVELPPCKHITCEVEPSKELMARYKKLEAALKTQIRKDQFVKDLSGKLFGALSELPSYLDRATADAGNQDDGSYGIYYPESVGGALVAKAEPFASSKILPKEQWMIDTVKAELAEGRNVMVLGWHVSLLPRLARLLEKATGGTVPVLYADKVPTSKRKAWIDRNIVAKGVRVMVANPVGISTGLNNLVHFSTEVWMEDPACNPQTFRQTNGRIHRIGQDLECRIYFPIYKGTLQTALHRLLMTKVAVSTATDGLDAESVLLAAGAGDDALLMGLSIGRQLWEMISKAN